MFFKHEKTKKISLISKKLNHFGVSGYFKVKNFGGCTVISKKCDFYLLILRKKCIFASWFWRKKCISSFKSKANKLLTICYTGKYRAI